MTRTEEAAQAIGAKRTSRGWRYYAPETGHWYRVTARELHALGGLLLLGVPDAYSVWCGQYPGRRLAR